MRILWGVVLVVLGSLFALQSFGVLPVSLRFWPVVLTIFGLYLVVRSLIPSRFSLRRGPSWFKLSFGGWLAAIGIVDILHANGITAMSGGDVWSVGWFILLIGAGLALIFGDSRISIRRGSSGDTGKYWNWLLWPDIDSHHGVRVGDLHYGREPWVLDRNLNVRQLAGDVRIDLTTADMAPGRHEIDIASRVGAVTLYVPEDCNANVRARVSTGSIDLFGERRDGIGVALERSVNVPGAAVTLDIDVRLHVGQVSVRRVPTFREA